MERCEELVRMERCEELVINEDHIEASGCVAA
jgi:hypothetical protein